MALAPRSMIMRRISPSALVVFVVASLVLGRDARAGGKVDWSEYIETPGARPPAMPATPRPAVKPAATPRKPARDAGKKPRAESRAKAKPPVRSKHRR
jgi:hypothetical protein